jgi:hypothetical protein
LLKFLMSLSQLSKRLAMINSFKNLFLSSTKEKIKKI